LQILSNDKTGIVEEIRDGVIYAKGLKNGYMGEIVNFKKANVFGIINYLGEAEKVGITVLGRADDIIIGEKVVKNNKLATVKVGNGLKGRVVNAIGEPLDGKGSILGSLNEVEIEKIAPGIIERQPVKETMETGVKFIDAMLPIGCGQRELIIGDPKTGKTAIAVDSIIAQKGKDVISIYVGIGQKQTSVLRVIKTLEKKQCMENTIIVAATAGEAAVMQYLAPYTGCAIGEYFMEKKHKDVLIIYDDLSKHAVAYRQMSLLLRRPPGREGYPGDVFYLHSRLLERSARLIDRKIKKKIKSGSLTAFPIIETIEGDVSAYIPTNVISITDGQIFLETKLFNKGIRPAINPGISVSRVGSAAQSKVMKKMAGSLKLELAQYREMEEFASLGLPLDDSSKFILNKGSRLQVLMKQAQSNPVNITCQLFLLKAGLNNIISDIAVNEINFFENKVRYLMKNKYYNTIINNVINVEVPTDIVVYFINAIKALSKDKESFLQ